MAQIIPIQAIANQSLSVPLDSNRWVISLKLAAGIMSATISRNDVTLVTGLRVTPGTPLLPYRYQEAGNFIFLTDGDAYPDYRQFGITQTLTYTSAAELGAIRA